MDTQIWSRTEEKWAFFLVLRGQDVFKIKITGNLLTIKKNIQKAHEALQAGEDPAVVGGKSTERLDVTKLVRAEVSPDKGRLTLNSGGEPATKLIYTTGDSNADVILQAILERAGQAFEPKQEEVGVVEAVLPPAILGAIAGALWFAIHDSAQKIAAGEVVLAKGRRQGLQKLLIMVSDTLGPTGTMALGIGLLVLILGWATMRIVKRPERTVWLPVTV